MKLSTLLFGVFIFLGIVDAADGLLAEIGAYIVSNSGPALLSLGTSAAGELLKGLFSKKPNNAELKAILEALHKTNKLLEEIKVSIQELPDQIEAILEEMNLHQKFSDIRGLWKKMYYFLEAFNNGRYPDREIYDRDFNDIVDSIGISIFQNIEWIDVDRHAEPYLDRIREGMLKDRVDLVTYAVQLSYAIEDYRDHYAKAIDLLAFAGSRSPFFTGYIGEIQEYMERLTDYKAKHVNGTWLPLVQHLLEGGDESFFTDHILRHYNSSSHLVASVDIPLHIAESNDVRRLEEIFRLRYARSSQTPLFITPFPGATIGNFSVNIIIDVNGERKPIGLSGVSVEYNFQSAGSERWKLTPCYSEFTVNESALNFVSIVNGETSLSLTISHATPDFGYGLTMGYQQQNDYQVWNFTTVQRCCTIYEEADFKGASLEICMGLIDSSKIFSALPEGIKSISSATCSVDTQLILSESLDNLGQQFNVSEGTSVSSIDPARISTIQSFVVKNTCSRIFTNQNMTGDYRTICREIPNLGEKFVDQNISIFIAGKALELYSEINFQGMVFPVTENMTSIDWLYRPKSVKVLEV